MASLGDMIVKIVADATEFNKTIDASKKRMEGATKSFESLGKKLTTFVTVPILGIGAASVKAAADMEMQQAAFETMLGSATKAKTLLSDLNELAASTPFQMTDLADATKTMLAFGISNEKVLPNLRMLGDIAGGNADKLKSLTLAFSQIQSTGRLMGQDLLQLINSGFNPLSIIAEKTGKSMAVLKKEMEQGSITAEMVSDAFKTATDEGGLFFGGMERASLTFNGLVSTLVDNVVMLGRSIGDEMLPKLKEIVKTITQWVGEFTALDSATKQAVIQYGLLAASIGPVIIGIVKLVQVLPQLKIALAALAANPIIVGMLALGSAIAVVAIESKKASAQAKALKDALAGAAELEEIRAVIKLKQEQIAYNEKFIEQNKNAAGMAQAGVFQAKQLLETQKKELIQLVANYNGKQMNIKATEELAAAETKRIEAELAAARKSITLTATMTDEEKKAAEENLKIWEDMYEARLQDEANARGDAIVAEAIALEEKEKQEKDAAKATEKIWQDTYNNILNHISTVFDSIIGLVSALRDKQLEQLNLQLQAELEAAGVSEQTKVEELQAKYDAAVLAGDAELANELAIELKREQIKEDYAKRAATIEYKAALASWKLQLAQGAAQAAIAIINGLSTKPFVPAGIAAGIVAGGLGAFQMAAINAAKPSPPALAEGGIVMPTEGGTLAQIAEAGQPEAVIPLDKLGGLGGDIHLVVQMDSKPFLDKIFPATRDRTILISSGAVV